MISNTARTFRWSRACLGLALLVAWAGPLLADDEVVLIDFGASVSYRANATDPGLQLEWVADDYVEDGSWSSGTFGLGFEVLPGPPGAHALISTPVPTDTRSIYTRSTFDITDSAAVTSLFLGLDYDDGVVAWINGVEVYRTPSMRDVPASWDATPLVNHESGNGSTPEFMPLRNLSDVALPALKDGTNVLALAVYNNGMEDLVLVPRLSINKMLTRGPYLQQGTPTSIRVRWRTAGLTSSRVYTGTDFNDLSDASGGPALTTEHDVLVSGLEPGTRYYYAISSGSEILAGGDDQHTFDTPPTTGQAKPTRLWALGDSGWGNLNATRVRDAFESFTGARGVDLWLMLGDNAYPDGKDVEYQHNLFEIYGDALRTAVLWPTPGNHDTPDSPGWPYFDNFTLPTNAEAGGIASGTENYYSFDYGNIHFIVLDSMYSVRLDTGPMVAWLESDLQSTTQDWIIVYWHHPPYSKGSHDSDNYPAEFRSIEMRENVLPVLDDYGVDLVLTGHSHSYERSFLVDGHYGYSDSFVEGMKIDGGDGSLTGDGAYIKPYRRTVPYVGIGDGIVYSVAGSSSSTSTGVGLSLGGNQDDHPVMSASLPELGSIVVDIDGNRLDAVFLDDNGNTLDEYTIFKGGVTQPPIADFQADPRIAAVAETVDFSDLSLNAPSGWSWDLDGDGSEDSTASQPSFSYPQIGSYTVSLTVTNSAGADSETRQAFICATTGLPDEILGLTVGGDRETIAWDPNPRALNYDIVKGDLDQLRLTGAFETSQLGCLTSTLDPFVVDAEQPLPGQALFYVARGTNCVPQTGTYDTTSPWQSGSRDLGLQSASGVCTCPQGDDDDLDGYCNAFDNCPDTASQSLADSDGDGQGDACDPCALDALNDIDGDGVCGDIDNCPDDPNTDQLDTDGDTDGNACDDDDDGDGVLDGADADPLDPLSCHDLDLDGCDDCANGNDDPLDDGPDADSDGICDVGDTCTDADADGLGTGTLGNSGCAAPSTDVDDANPFACGDTDGDGCEDCSGGHWNPADDGPDDDADSICNGGDNCPQNPNPGQEDFDVDGTGNVCDTCTDSDDDGFGNPGYPANLCPEDNCPSMSNPGQLDQDNDGDGDLCDVCPLDPLNDEDMDFFCANLDNCPQINNPSQADADGDALGDACDTCTDSDGDGFGDGVPEDLCLPDNCPTVPNPEQRDFDNDSLGDACDPDDDNDGVADADDVDPKNRFSCRDDDGDQCDDCGSGTVDPSNDGPDTDADGQCNLGDNCDLTPNPGQQDADSDDIGDACDECTDADGDGLGAGTLGNVGCLHPLTDSNDGDPAQCADVDTDGCDDCSAGSWSPSDDGPDADADGACDLTDDCTDADGDGLGNGNLGNVGCAHRTIDADDADGTSCADVDGDGCDDCSGGSWNPAADGGDQDTDGVCDTGDNCPGTANPGQGDLDGDGTGNVCDDCTDADGDGLGTGTLGNVGCAHPTIDSNDGNPLACADTDADTCDDCISGTWNPSTDGADSDLDGLCDPGDDCTDADGDGLGTGTGGNAGCAHPAMDSDDGNPLSCGDTDGDGCEDCLTGSWDPGADGTDTDADGLCDGGDACTDADGDGVGNGNLGNFTCVTPVDDSDDSDPLSCADTDGDGCDDCSTGTWSPAIDGPDADSDGICDTGDACPADPFNDMDGDGECGDEDNCPSVANDLQSDLDANGVGDACEYVPIGGVFYMAATEVTNSQYAVFLNAVAQADPHELYHEDMGGDPRGGIVRSGSSGDYSYFAKPSMTRKPVSFVSWLDALRYVNWLQNDRPVGPQGPATTEQGAYDLTVGDPEDNATRTPGAAWFLPTKAEWDAAAYADPSMGSSWLYPTRSNAAPATADASLGGAVTNPGLNVANYDRGADWNGQDGNVTDVAGAGPLSASFWGTYDQAGNVGEWTETQHPGGDRYVRGGSYRDAAAALRVTSTANESPDRERDRIGFRVAAGVSCNDTDGDGFGSPAGPACNGGVTSDNCPLIPNPDQADDDGDGLGNACDPCTDGDGDGLGTGVNGNAGCLDGTTDSDDANPLACSDVDADGCDDCSAGTWNPSGDGTDADTDGVCDTGDNCPGASNPAQLDHDGDLLGDACDDDDDGDGVDDAADCLPLSPGVASAPGSVGDTVRLQRTNGSSIELTWLPGFQGHTSNLYSVARPAGQAWSSAFACQAAEIVGTTAAVDGAQPTGTVEYYLVGARNACGDSPSPSGMPECPGLGNDTDGDGVPDLEDNCPAAANPDQADADQDFVGDVCDQ